MNKEIRLLLEAESLSTITVPKGTVVCSEGHSCEGLVFVTEGWVSVSKRSEEGHAIALYDIKEGESCILTLSCILNQQPFPAEAVAQSEVKGIMIPSHLVQAWLTSKPIWTKYVLSVISSKLAEVIGLVEALAFSHLPQRLEAWLLRHAESGLVRHTHQEIAEGLGSSREVISRLLKHFEQAGKVRLARGAVELLKLAGLDTK